MIKTLIIIPAYNEEECIKNTVNDLIRINPEIDVVVINDGSKDNTSKEAKKTKATVIDLPVNLGIGGAVQTGYIYALKNDYDIAIQYDGDGQHRPEYIKQMIEKIKDNDLVIASRFIKENEYKQTISRMAGIKLIRSIIKICTGKSIYDPTSGYRAANKKVIQEFAQNYPHDYPEPETNLYLLRQGYKIKEIPSKMNNRKTGKSSITPFKSIYYMIKVSLAMFICMLQKGEK